VELVGRRDRHADRDQAELGEQVQRRPARDAEPVGAGEQRQGGETAIAVQLEEAVLEDAAQRLWQEAQELDDSAVAGLEARLAEQPGSPKPTASRYSRSSSRAPCAFAVSFSFFHRLPLRGVARCAARWLAAARRSVGPRECRGRRVD
jgi:hypothetical protein